MDKKKNKQGKVIGNIGTLDLRFATEESLAEIGRVGNVGTVLYSSENAHLVPGLNAGNIGSRIEAPKDAKHLSGQTVFNKHSFQETGKPMSFVVSGQLIIEPDIPVKSIETGIGELVISGQIIVPEHLSGVIQSKIRHLSGELKTYDQRAQLVTGSLALNEAFLRALDDSSKLMVMGNLTATQVLPDDLVRAKIGNVQVAGSVKVREENVEALIPLLDRKQRPAKVTIIPAGFELVEKPLVLSDTLLQALSNQKLYCTGLVRFDEGVESETLDKALEALVVTDMLIAPVPLTQIISSKINLLETRAIFYEGALWLVEDEATIAAARFEFLSGQATLVVLGEVTFAPDVDPESLFGRLDKVHNFGVISGNPKQIAAVQARMGHNEGVVEDSSGLESKGEKDVGNVGYLQL